MTIPSEIKSLESYYNKIFKTGSRVICDPPPTDTDEDYILLIPVAVLGPLASHLLTEGYTKGGSLGPVEGSPFLLSEHEYNSDGSVKTEGLFQSWKKGELNIILTANEQYFDDFVRATFLAKALNLTDKEDRVTLFRALCQNIWPTESKKKNNLVYQTVNNSGVQPLQADFQVSEFLSNVTELSEVSF